MDEKINEDVERRIRAGLLNWRLAFEVLCNRHKLTRLKEKFYRTEIRGYDLWSKMLLD